MVLSKGGYPINQNGMIYSNENISIIKKLKDPNNYQYKETTKENLRNRIERIEKLERYKELEDFRNALHANQFTVQKCKLKALMFKLIILLTRN